MSQKLKTLARSTNEFPHGRWGQVCSVMAHTSIQSPPPRHPDEPMCLAWPPREADQQPGEHTDGQVDSATPSHSGKAWFLCPAPGLSPWWGPTLPTPWYAPIHIY